MPTKQPKTRKTQQQKNAANRTRKSNLASGKTKPRRKTK